MKQIQDRVHDSMMASRVIVAIFVVAILIDNGIHLRSGARGSADVSHAKARAARLLAMAHRASAAA